MTDFGSGSETVTGIDVDYAGASTELGAFGAFGSLGTLGSFATLTLGILGSLGVLTLGTLATGVLLGVAGFLAGFILAGTSATVA